MVSGALVSVLSCSDGFSWPGEQKHKIRQTRSGDTGGDKPSILRLLYKTASKTILKAKFFDTGKTSAWRLKKELKAGMKGKKLQQSEEESAKQRKMSLRPS